MVGMAVAPAGDRLRLVDLVWDPRRHAPALRVGAIDAPVFDYDGQVALALSASSFDRPLRRDEVVRIGERLRAAATGITDSLHGASVRSR